MRVEHASAVGKKISHTTKTQLCEFPLGIKEKSLVKLMKSAMEQMPNYNLFS